MTHEDTPALAIGVSDRLSLLWAEGYSIAELWGHSEPVTRGTSSVEAAHLLLWGILSIVEYQVSRGAGHRYLRARLWAGDWIAIGDLDCSVAHVLGGEPVPTPDQVRGRLSPEHALEAPGSRLCRVPRLENAKFSRKVSAVGDGTTKYTGVRIVHSQFNVPGPRNGA